MQQDQIGRDEIRINPQLSVELLQLSIKTQKVGDAQDKREGLVHGFHKFLL